MIHHILRRRIAPLVISFAAAISLSAHAQVLNAALSGPIPAILVQPQPDTNQELGLGGIIYNARRCVAALGQILGT